jgi:hypothetical protein
MQRPRLETVRWDWNRHGWHTRSLKVTAITRNTMLYSRIEQQSRHNVHAAELADRQRGWKRIGMTSLAQWWTFLEQRDQARLFAGFAASLALCARDKLRFNRSPDGGREEFCEF